LSHINAKFLKQLRFLMFLFFIRRSHWDFAPVLEKLYLRHWAKTNLLLLSDEEIDCCFQISNFTYFGRISRLKLQMNTSRTKRDLKKIFQRFFFNSRLWNSQGMEKFSRMDTEIGVLFNIILMFLILCLRILKLLGTDVVSNSGQIQADGQSTNVVTESSIVE